MPNKHAGLDAVIPVNKPRRTICDVHRQIYAIAEELELGTKITSTQIVMLKCLTAEAFEMGLKMNNALAAKGGNWKNVVFGKRIDEK